MGETHKASVGGVAEFGLFCELEDVLVEGLVPAESLGEGVKLEKKMQRLVVGNSGRSYGVGDEILVEVVGADPARRRITLGLAEKGVYSDAWQEAQDVTPDSRKSRRPPPRGPGGEHRRPPPEPPPRPPTPRNKRHAR